MTFFLVGSYVSLLVYILEQWENIPNYTNPKVDNSPLSFTYLIIARNEQDQIKATLDAVFRNIVATSHEVEVMVIDDHSTDRTVELVSAYGTKVKLIQLSDHLTGPLNAYKKRAISLGNAYAQGDYIIQVDADVIVPVSHLESIAGLIQLTGATVIAAPVLFTGVGHLGHFQTLDMIGMMGVTGAGIHAKKWYMANGANLTYRKGSQSFDGADRASGDDMQIIERVSQQPGSRIVFSKDIRTLVTTPAEPTLADFYKQRLRWATKNKYTRNRTLQWVMIVPYLNALWLMVHLVLLFILGSTAFVVLLFHLLCKLVMDRIYLSELSEHFEYTGIKKYFRSSSLFHPLYLMIIGTLSLFVSKYEWKGRQVH